LSDLRKLLVWLPGYGGAGWLASDLVAGLIVWSVVPQAVAYVQIAGLRCAGPAAASRPEGARMDRCSIRGSSATS
jgi:MFS superfamily sulfate permease-like transporter